MIFKKKGFTLIELVITFLIVVIVFSVLANLVGFSTKFFKDENTQVSSQTSLRLVYVEFEKDVRKYVSSSSQISESVVSSDYVYVLGDPSTVNKVTYTYKSESNQIFRDSVLIASNVQDFDIEIVLATKPYLNFSITSIPDNRGKSNHFDLVIYLRIESVN